MLNPTEDHESQDLFSSEYGFTDSDAEKGANILKKKYPGCSIFSLDSSLTPRQTRGVTLFFKYLEKEFSWMKKWNNSGTWKITVSPNQEDEFLSHLEMIAEK